MRSTATSLRFATATVVLVLFTAMIVVVFGQLRFDKTYQYSAIFTNASSLKAGQFVRANGVEVGKVAKVELLGDGENHVRIDFNVERTLQLFDGTTAAVRYLNLIGDRYLELGRGDSQRPLPPGGTIPLSHTEPALDLDALIGGFRPLFRSLDPEKVNNIAQSLVAVFQGQGGTINDILDQTASLTSQLAARDQAIGQVISNLNTVLDTTVAHRRQFDDTINRFEQLISGLKTHADPIANSAASISTASGVLADLLTENRPQLQSTLSYLETLQLPLVAQRDQLGDILTKLPNAFQLLGRSGGVYGDFFNFYFCDISLQVNGLQPGGPTRTIKLITEPTGRCTPR